MLKKASERCYTDASKEGTTHIGATIDDSGQPHSMDFTLNIKYMSPPVKMHVSYLARTCAAQSKIDVLVGRNK
jgi:hypothetical protein